MREPLPPELRATRAAYDVVAEDYAALLRDELAGKPLDRALLAAFAELVNDGPVLDAGCGPGRVAGHLVSLGLDVAGVDLSPGMVTVARREHPALRFDVGSLTALQNHDASFAGVLAWYSLIHLPPDQLPLALSELARVLRPGGHLLAAFQLGAERVRLDRPYGHDVRLDAYRLDPDRIADLLADVGVRVVARTIREGSPGNGRLRPTSSPAASADPSRRYGFSAESSSRRIAPVEKRAPRSYRG